MTNEQRSARNRLKALMVDMAYALAGFYAPYTKDAAALKELRRELDKCHSALVRAMELLEQ